MSKQRNSSIELMRLLAQYMIVAYHILMVFYVSNPLFAETPIYKALCLPLHIGVPAFVMISGYFGIRCSAKGFSKLLACILIYSVGLQLASVPLGGGVISWKTAFFVSCDPYWFMRIYVLLYILSPWFNKMLENTNILLLLLCLTYICVIIPYFGEEPSLKDGKNIPTFLYWYAIGHAIHKYKSTILNIHLRKIILTYTALNLLLVVGYCFLSGSILGKALYGLSFAYYSPVLLVNAALFLVMFLRFEFTNNLINKIASSCLPIYLIHGSHLGIYVIVKNVTEGLIAEVNSTFLMVMIILTFALCLVAVCILIDQILSPLKSLIEGFFEKVLNFITNQTLLVYSSLTAKVHKIK